MPIQAAPTVRESLESAVESVAPDEAQIATPETAAPIEAPVAPEGETEAQKEERLRNKDGTFAKGKPDPKPEAKAPAIPSPVQAAPVVPEKPKTPMPSSWKKELGTHWDTLPPEVQSNVIEREKQYASGVSAYKSEADRAKSVMQSVSQFEPMLQKRGIQTDKWIQQMGIAHYLIAEGSPQERVQAVAQIIKNNGVDVNALGQLLAGQQPTYQQQPQQTQLPQPPVDIEAKVNEALQKREIEAAYSAFEKDVTAGKYPHFSDEAVKGTMAGLLQSGLAQDYPSAYDAALALPQHRHLVAPQTPAPATQVADPAVQKQAQAQRARSQAVSVKSSTPSAMTQTQGPKSLREQLSDVYDSKAAASRV